MLLTTVSACYSEKAEESAENEPNQDVIVADDERGLYIVCDGAGGNGGKPESAAKAAAKSIYFSLGNIQPRSELDFKAHLKHAYDKARDDVRKYGEGGSTVATTVKLINYGGKTYAGIAHAGDTLAFLYSKKTDSFIQLTKNQSRGNIVKNLLPRPASDEAPDQYRVIQLDYGDRLMMCSDGITGDWQDQFLSNEEALDSFRKRTPWECVLSFVRQSKKNDDKSCIVFDTKPAK